MLESPKGRQALLCSINGNDVPKKFAHQSSLPRLATFLNYMRGDVTGSGKSRQSLTIWAKNKGVVVEEKDPLMAEAERGDGVVEDGSLRTEQ